MSDAAEPWGAVLARWLRRRETTLVALTLLAAAIFEFRLGLLLATPYPPSGDAGGDLYNAHAWLGHGLPALSQSPLAPPLYSFAIVLPFTTVFPTFVGVQLYMAFVPALLVFPAYLLVRESGAGPWASTFGAGLLAISAIWSLMVTWNAAYNLFGIFFLIFFLVFLVRYLRAPSIRAGFYVAIPLALVGLSHQLTFLIALMVLFVALLWLVLLAPLRGWRPAIRLAGPTGLLSLPVLVLYASLASSVSTAGGGSSYLPNLFWALQTGPFFTWGYQGVKLDLVILVDLVLSVLALAYLRRSPDATPFAVALIGVLFAAVAVVVIDPGNAARGLYFLPIPFMAPIPVYLERGIAGRLKDPSPGDAWGGPALEGLAGRLRGSPSGRQSISVVVTAFALGLLLVNTSVSANVMSAGIVFNDSLKPPGVAALDWVHAHTPTNATFFDGAGLQTWMWGYAERMDYAPASLNVEVTQQSLTFAEDADLADLGSYLLTDPYWIVSSSFPSGEGTPQVYLATPGTWEPFLGTEADHDTVELQGTEGPHWVGLQYANETAAVSNDGSSSLAYRFGLSWPASNDSAQFTSALNGSDFHLAWSPGDARPLAVNYSFNIPPSGYFFDYRSFPTEANVTSITDGFALNGVPFTVTFTGGVFTQETLATGWGQLEYQGNGNLSATTTGMTPQNTLPTRAIATAPLIHALKIDYAIVDTTKDYPVFARLRAGVFWNGPAVLLFQSGSVIVLGP